MTPWPSRRRRIRRQCWHTPRALEERTQRLATMWTAAFVVWLAIYFGTGLLK